MKTGIVPFWYNIIILSLSLYVLIQLSIEIIVTIPARTSAILSWIDLSICVIFLCDWFFFLFRADNKKRYIKSRFFDLIASIPFAQALRPFRALRIIRIIRVLRLSRGAKGTLPVLRFLLKNPARSALTIYLTVMTVIYFYCSLGLYNFENGINPSISSFGDVLWMAFTTLTSVGYGDIYPVTGEGRILAAILVIIGMGLFSLLTAEIATVFLRLVKERKE